MVITITGLEAAAVVDSQINHRQFKVVMAVLEVEVQVLLILLLEQLVLLVLVDFL